MPSDMDVNVYDTTVSPARQRRTLTVYTAYGLPDEVYEFEGCCAALRRTHVEYNFGAAYTSRRVIGLPTARMLYDGAGALQSRVEYGYDAGGEFLQQQGTPVRHDAANYGTGFVQGRGLVTSVRRYNVNNQSEYFTSTVGYNTTGSAVFSRDPKQHQTTIGYADAFTSTTDPNQTVSYNTYAYPTTITDGDGFASVVQYNYDMGALRRTQDPKGAAGLTLYDRAGRVERVVNLNSNAYTRHVYGTTNGYVQSFSLQEGGAESYSIQMFDGAGRVRASAAAHPNSAGGYGARYAVYDVMGRAVEQSDPYEITAAWVAAGDDAAGHHRTQQTYDWQGRPLVTTHTADGTTRELSYGGCGCAGGVVVTERDEVGRRQRTTHDALGRTWKVEVLNMDGSVYSTTSHRYNGRDQIVRVRVYAGSAPSPEPEGEGGGYQTTTMTYDGHGRLQSSKSPIQSAAVTYSYDTDDVMLTATDPRGVVTTYGFTHAGYTNKRHLVNTVTRTNVPAGVTATATVSYEYDAAGNRTKMTDGTGSVEYIYNALSQLTSETRRFSGLPNPTNPYTVTYGYTVTGQLKTLADPFGMVITYGYDSMGRPVGVAGSGPVSVPSYASNLRYRAWGGLKSMAYGNGVQRAAQFDARLRETRREFTGLVYNGQSAVTFGSESEYWADGRVRYARDLQDGNFDRKYDYDHAGRIKEAYSGREARGLPPLSTPDNPLRQTFSYDVWGNMGRAARHWTNNVTDAPTYANDRRGDWTYDAAGSVTVSRSGAQTHGYDAAGEKVHYNEENWAAAGLDEYTVEQGYDGAGRPGRRVVTRYNWDAQTGAETTEVTGTYYVRSTVLGGAAVAELDEAGGKRKGCVYLGGEKLAEHESFPAGWVLTWRLADPARSSWVEADAGRWAVRRELDPLGADVGAENPYATTAEPSYADLMESDPVYSERGNPFDIRGGCVVDGVAASCSEVRRRVEAGTVWAEVTDLEGSRRFVGGEGLFFGSHGISVWVSNPVDKIIREKWTLVDEGRWEEIPFGAGFGNGLGVQRQDTDYWAWSYEPLAGAEITEQRRLLESTLSDEVCGTFVTQWLEELGRVTQVPVFNTNLLVVFDQIVRTGTMTTTEEPVFGRAGGSAGAGTGVVRLNLHLLATLPQGPAARAHEIAHAASRGHNPHGHYRHVDMNEAAFNVLTRRGIASQFGDGSGTFDRSANRGDGTNYGGWAMDALCAGVNGMMRHPF